MHIVLTLVLIILIVLSAFLTNWFWVVPTLKNQCIIFTNTCLTITYKTDGLRLLVYSPQNITYYYDGVGLIYAYGATLPGTCENATLTNELSSESPVVTCLAYGTDGTCIAPTPPFTTIKRNTITSPIELEPSFVFNAFSMTPVDTTTFCAPARHIVENEFETHPFQYVKIHVKQQPVNMTDLFNAFAVKQLFIRPQASVLPECSGNGKRLIDGTCVCLDGWKGTNCQLQTCETTCNNGTCQAGVCVCSPGWGGFNCATRQCDTNCNYPYGKCVNGLCVCGSGYGGTTCTEKLCSPECMNCDTTTGICMCSPGFTGPACMGRACPSNCSGQGVCNELNGTCVCNPGYTGVACEMSVCTCGPRGTCTDTGTCECEAGWGGNECRESVCPGNGCCGHGTCADNGMCTCVGGWSGNDCSVPDNPLTTTARCPTTTF